jgi:hypothetical protein
MNDSNCVEMARLTAGQLGLRDTKRGAAGPVLRLSRNELMTFVTKIKEGEFDL